MTLFLGTLIVIALCALAVGLGVLSGRPPPAGGCCLGGLAAGRCADCPDRPRTEHEADRA